MRVLKKYVYPVAEIGELMICKLTRQAAVIFVELSDISKFSFKAVVYSLPASTIRGNKLAH